MRKDKTLKAIVTLISCVILTATPAAATPQEDICSVFKRHCREAIRVAHCESRFKTYARNGQYLGVFQMGEWERSTYGHGTTVKAQARAAYRYFAATGYDWSPWTCKP